MTGRTSRIRKHMLICFALENYDFFVEIMEKRRLFFCNFDIIDDSIGYATKYHTYKLLFFFYLCWIKSYRVFLFKICQG